MLDEASQRTFVCGLGLWAVALFAAWSLELGWTERCLTRAAVHVEGVVTGKVQKGGKGGPSFHLIYTFPDRSRQLAEGRQRVAQRTYDDTTVGNSVEVLFCPQASWRNTLDLAQLGRERSRMLDMTALMSIAVAAYIVYFWFKAALARRRTSTSRPAADPSGFATLDGRRRRR